MSDRSKWISWAGLAAVVGGLTAIILTPLFASAYYSAYPGHDIPPFWVQPLKPALGALLTFASPEEVYTFYGRLFNLVYLFMLPAVFGLHYLHRGAGTRAEKWGFYLLVIGLLATFIGVAGDYWANGAGFFVELLGLIVLSIGAAVYGVATLSSKVIPHWLAWLLVACLPGVFVFMPLIGHIPSGPTFLFAASWLIVGYMLLFKNSIIRS